MIYLEYKLEKANIKDLKQVYVNKTNNDWFFPQFLSEIQILFPDVVVKELNSKLSNISFCDLIVFPYEGEIHSRLKHFFSELTGYPCAPVKNVMFYAVDKRVIDIVAKKKLIRWVIRKMVDRICIFCVRQLVRMYNTITRQKS